MIPHLDPILRQMNCVHNLKHYKVVPVVFNRAPRHESVLGDWRYSSTNSRPQHWMEVSGQLHAPAALPPGKEPLVRIE